MDKHVLIFVAATIAALSATVAHAGTVRDVYTDGSRVMGARDPYTDGGLATRFDVYADGAKAGKFDSFTDGTHTPMPDRVR